MTINNNNDPNFNLSSKRFFKHSEKEDADVNVWWLDTTPRSSFYPQGVWYTNQKTIRELFKKRGWELICKEHHMLPNPVEQNTSITSKWFSYHMDRREWRYEVFKKNYSYLLIICEEDTWSY